MKDLALIIHDCELTIKHFDSGDWYSIIKRHHDVKEWWHQVDPSLRCYIMTNRISDCCVEGSKEEMTSIAHAVIDGKSYEAHRCAVSKPTDGDYVFFWSPRNSRVAAGVTVEVADRLAHRILARLI